jgi:hypothetical protein
MIYIHSHEFMKIISENSTYHFKAIYTFKYNTNQIRFNYHQESQNVHFHKIAPKNIYIMWNEFHSHWILVIFNFVLSVSSFILKYIKKHLDLKIRI